MIKKVLFAIPCFDPNILGDKDNVGVILKLLHEKTFDETVLFGLQPWKLNMVHMEQAIASQFPNIIVRKHMLPIKSISVYKEIFYTLKSAIDSYEILLRDVESDLNFLLPPVQFDRLLDCWLLLLLSLPQKIHIWQIDDSCTPQMVHQNVAGKTENIPFELHDSILEDQLPPLPLLSSEQVYYLQDLLRQGINFCLRVKNDAVQHAVLEFMQQYTQANGYEYTSIKCADLPPEIAGSLLWGYEAHLYNNRKLRREGLLMQLKTGSWLSLSHFNVLLNTLQSDIVSFLSKVNCCHFVTLSTVSQPFLQIPTYLLPD